MSDEGLSARGSRIVAALTEFADDLEAGVSIESKYAIRQVRAVRPPGLHSPADIRGLRQVIGTSQDLFAQILAVSPTTVQAWEDGTRKPSALARRLLDEIRRAPDHFRALVADDPVRPASGESVGVGVVSP